MDSHKKFIKNPELKYKGIWDCFESILYQEGALAFWRGNLANIYRYFPTNAFNFAFKQKIEYYFAGQYDPNTDFWRFLGGNLLSGAAAGAGSSVFVYPLDFARTRLATDSGKKDQRQFRGLTDCIMKVVRHNGMGGIYKGFGMSLVGNIIYRAGYFGFFDTAKVFLSNETTIVHKFILAQLITSTSGFLAYPADTIFRRMIMQSGKDKLEIQYESYIDCFRKIRAQEGYSGFYKGA